MNNFISKKIFILLSLLLLTKSIMGINLSKITPQDDFIAFGDVEKAKKKLSILKDEKEDYKKREPEFTKEVAQKEASIQSELLKTRQPTNFANEKRAKLEETYQAIQDLGSLRKQIKDLINQNIKLLEDYTQDPTLNSYIKKYREAKIYYYEDLLDLQQMIQAQKERIERFKEQKENTQIELEAREDSLKAIDNELINKKKILEDFSKDPEKTKIPDPMFQFNNEQIVDLLKTEENLLKIKSDLETEKLEETEYKLTLLEDKVLIANLELGILKKRAMEIKPIIQITEAHIGKDAAEFQALKGKYVKIQSDKRKEVAEKLKEYTKDQEELERQSKKQNVAIDRQLEIWDIEPARRNGTTFALANYNEKISKLNLEKENLNAEIKQIDAALDKKKLYIDIKRSFYKEKNGKFLSEKEINEEIKQYKNNKTEINRKILEYNDKINLAKEILKSKNQALANIRALQKKYQVYSPIGQILAEAVRTVNSQVKYLKKTIETYENTIDILQKSEEPVDLIISQLEPLVGKWYRPEYAIKWKEIKNVPLGIKEFGNKLKLYILQFSIPNFLETIKMTFPKHIDIVRFIIKLLLLIFLILLFKTYAPIIYKKLLSLSPTKTSVKFLTLSLAFVLEFLIKYLALISIWLLLLFSLHATDLPDKGIMVIFYLLSIPYLLYIANRCLKHLELFNKKHNLLSFLLPSYQKRLLKVAAIILYSTIIIQLFKKAFKLEMIYYPSELPSVLSALNWIIAQVALILLITKQLIERVIPKNWKWLQIRADKFYYIILTIAVIIIIMANPYIGFGRLLLYVIQRLLLSIILLISLFMLHKLIKRISLKIFFKTEDDVFQTRFTYGKPIYGLYVILTFILLVLIGILLGSYIWDLNITVHSIYDLLTNKIFSTKTGEKTWTDISVLSFIQIFVFLILGFIFSFLINKYVLKRIFDLLLVETGMQYAITSILRYVIILTFLLIGLNKVGLGGSIFYLGASILAIGYLAKEPISDFLYYFLILIQRPLKIGDYVKMEDGTQGIVRKITPRATILKFRNSETKIVPNSKMLMQPITNWNYTSGFVAFDDMKLTIPYKYNPQLVKNLLLEVLDKHPNILKSPKPVVRLENFGEYGFQLLIRGFVSSHYTLDMWDIASDIRFGIIKALKDNNIEIAEPVRIIKSPRQARGTAPASIDRQGAENEQSQE